MSAEYTPPEAQVPAVREGHSGFGIASFVISMVAVPAWALLFGLSPRATTEQQTALVGALTCGFALANLVGLAFGIVGVVQRGRRKVFPVLGIVFNTVEILGVGVLMLLGVAMLAAWS